MYVPKRDTSKSEILMGYKIYSPTCFLFEIAYRTLDTISVITLGPSLTREQLSGKRGHGIPALDTIDAKDNVVQA